MEWWAGKGNGLQKGGLGVGLDGLICLLGLYITKVIRVVYS